MKRLIAGLGILALTGCATMQADPGVDRAKALCSDLSMSARTVRMIATLTSPLLTGDKARYMDAVMDVLDKADTGIAGYCAAVQLADGMTEEEIQDLIEWASKAVNGLQPEMATVCLWRG